MNQNDLSPDCGRIRTELAGLVYDEPAPDTRAVLEEHLAGCAACREELAALRDTRRMLARWETPAVSEDPRLLARSIVRQARGLSEAAPAAAPRRGRLMRFTAMASATAAAGLFLLALLGTHASVENGRLELSFGLPGARPATTPVAGAPLSEDLVRSIAHEAANQAVQTRAASFEQGQEELLQRYQLMTREEMQQEILRLSRTLDVVLAEKDRAYLEQLTNLGREAARADLEQRDRIEGLYRILPASNTTPTNR